MSELELKVKPPILWVILAIPALLGEFEGVHSMHFNAACVLLLLAGFLGIGSLLQFMKAATTHHPHTPEQSSTLVTKGCYQLTRNPMYLGLLLMLIAVHIAFASGWGFLSVPLFVVWLTRFQIQVEERVLRERFGQTYINYCQRVRRWI